MHQMYANVVAKAFFQCPALLLMAATLVAISLSIQRKPYLITDHAILVDAENSSSVLSRCFMTWSRDSMRIASEMSKLDALPVLNHKTRSKNQPSLRDSTQDLMTQVLVQRIHVIVRQWSLTILRTTLTFGCPYCVLRLIACVESNDLDLAWVWLCGTVLFATCETVVHYHQNWIQWSELGIPIRAQLMTATYQKLLRTEGDEHMNDTQAKLGSPTVNTLLTSDATIVSKFSAIHYILPLSMLKLAIALMFIQRLLGWRGMSTALIITMTSMPINMLVVSKRKLAQKKLRKARDQKDKAIGEMIKTLHHIKLQGNEELWKQRVRICRSNELCAERQDLHAQNISLIWKIASPLLVSSVSIFVNAYFEGQITASVIFTILELLPQLQGTLGLAPLVIQDYLSARASSRRIESFLGSPDRDDYVQANDAGHIAFRDATFMWSDSRSKSVPAVQDIGPAFRLERVSICFPARHLSIIHGTTGSGKSLMLAAILGEAKLLKGVIEAPRAASGCPVAIVTQTPWLQSTTIKENILFGENYDASRYNSVLEACALIQDLQAFQYGDRTTIGAQGVKVSGGQHARISLARALYSRATTILLDDILSALDSRVARHVLDALDGPLGTGRTRILVTHQLELCIPKASYVVHISNGTARGSAQSLTNNHQARSLGLDEASQDTISRRTSYAAEQILGSDAHIDKRQKLTKSTRDVAVKDSPMAPFQLYIGALGGSSFVTIFCVALIIRQVLVILPTWTLKNIKVLGEGAASQDSTVDGIVCHVSLFVACSVLAVLAEYLFHAHQASGTLRASEILFNTMLDTVIQMPLTWIDGVPTGDLTQRFCTDLQAMDDRLMPLVSEFLQCAIEMLTIIVVGYARVPPKIGSTLMLVKPQSVFIYQLYGSRRSICQLSGRQTI
jgi:ABC-type multidrug transport system fused ATPase/permease subunit